ncbi:MAG TPA: formate acetyltransferase, partial [Spirochaetes bacterium]|nr:formate acetyltransferase [Spirochaetota bacterium]
MLMYANLDGARKSSAHYVINLLMRLVSLNFNHRPGLNRYLKSKDGWINFTVGIRTDSGSVGCGVAFRDGRVSVEGRMPGAPDVTLVFDSDRSLMKLLGATPTEQVYMFLKSQLRSEGNASYMNLFLFLVSLLLNKKQKKQMEKERTISRRGLLKRLPVPRKELSDEVNSRRAYRMKSEGADPGVKYLKDPYLAGFSLDDFPRVKKFLDLHFTTRAEVCPELPALVTAWHRENGFETDREGRPWSSILRKARAYAHLMENRKPIIRENDLLAGTTTMKDVGVVVYPEGHGTMIWSELLTVPHRTLNPYDVSEETLKVLHHDVFPYWAKRNFKEWVRSEYGNPLCQRIDERWAV